MNRHVWCVGNQCTVCVEDGTREIKTFLDVDRVCGVLKGDPHLFRDRHEQVVEHFEHDGVGVRSNGFCAFQRHDTLRGSRDPLN